MFHLCNFFLFLFFLFCPSNFFLINNFIVEIRVGQMYVFFFDQICSSIIENYLMKWSISSTSCPFYFKEMSNLMGYIYNDTQYWTFLTSRYQDCKAIWVKHNQTFIYFFIFWWASLGYIASYCLLDCSLIALKERIYLVYNSWIFLMILLLILRF